MNALSRLTDGEICRLVIRDSEIEAAWSVPLYCWIWQSGLNILMIDPRDVDEWMPAELKS